MHHGCQSDEDHKVFLGNLDYTVTLHALLHWLEVNHWELVDRNPYMVPKGDLVNLIVYQGMAGRRPSFWDGGGFEIGAKQDLWGGESGGRT